MVSLQRSSLFATVRFPYLAMEKCVSVLSPAPSIHPIFCLYEDFMQAFSLPFHPLSDLKVLVLLISSDRKCKVLPLDNVWLPSIQIVAIGLNIPSCLRTLWASCPTI